MEHMDEDKAIRNFIIIFVIVILVVVGIYFFTKLVVNKDESSTTTNETKEVEINNSVAIVGTMLNKSEDHYYVILYRSEDEKSYDYSSVVTNYNATDKKLAMYTVDLSNALNSKFYDKENIKLDATDINDLRFGDITLLEVKDGKISKSYNSLETIKKALKLS